MICLNSEFLRGIPRLQHQILAIDENLKDEDNTNTWTYNKEFHPSFQILVPNMAKCIQLKALFYNV